MWRGNVKTRSRLKIVRIKRNKRVSGCFIRFFAVFVCERPTLDWCAAATLGLIDRHIQSVQQPKRFINICAGSMSIGNFNADFRLSSYRLERAGVHSVLFARTAEKLGVFAAIVVLQHKIANEVCAALACLRVVTSGAYECEKCPRSVRAIGNNE